MGKIMGEKIIWSAAEFSRKQHYIFNLNFFRLFGDIPLILVPFIFLLLGLFISPLFFIFLIIYIFLEIKILRYWKKRKRKLNRNQKVYYITPNHLILESNSLIDNIHKIDGVKLINNRYFIVNINKINRFTIKKRGKALYDINFYLNGLKNRPILTFHNLNIKEKSKIINIIIAIVNFPVEVNLSNEIEIYQFNKKINY